MTADIPRLRLDAQGISQPNASTPLEVVTRLGAVQAQDYHGALWAIGLRIAGATRADVERAVAERSIVRTWPMRGTLHFVPAADARWMLELLAPRTIANAAVRHRQLELDDAAFRRSRRILERALTREPVLTRVALFAELERGGVVTGSQRGIHILQRLAMERLLCFGPHAGKQPTFALFDQWISGSRALDRDEALRTIAERYFRGHGPATLRDFAWWTGLRMADARTALHLAQPSLVRLVANAGELWMSAEEQHDSQNWPRAHLLPPYDEYMVGFTDRSAALEPRYAGHMVPGGNGVFFAILVLDGQVVGTWRRAARAKVVEIEGKPFASLKPTAKRSFGAPVGRYAHFLGVPASMSWPSVRA
jgi:hypothetical protein